MIYETNKAEVTSIVADRAGNIYAASIGEKRPRADDCRAHAPAFPERRVAPRLRRTASPGVVLAGADLQRSSSRQFLTLSRRVLHRRRGSGEDRAGRLAGNALDLARRPRVRDGTVALRQNSCWAPATMEP